MSEEKDYDYRLQRRLKILKKKMEDGNVHIAEGLGVIESLKKVRYLPDGNIDLETVDGAVRSMALAVEGMHERQEIKKSISLEEVQNLYFEHIELNFNIFYQKMLETDATIEMVANFFSQNEEFVKGMTSQLLDFVESIFKFWDVVDHSAWYHTEDMNCLKGVYGGSFFPSNRHNVASMFGVYTDTIILPDPFVRMRDYLSMTSDNTKVYYIMKQALSLLKYKKLATTQLENPIVVVLPDFSKSDDDEKEFVNKLGMSDALIHAEHLFGVKFESFQHLIEFGSSLDSFDKVLKEIKDVSRLEFTSETGVGLEEQLKKYMEQDQFKAMNISNPGLAVALSGHGRMTQANDLLLKSRRFQGIPLMDAPESWKFFNQKLEYDAYRIDPENMKHMHMCKGLQNLSDGKMEWLGNVPQEALIEVRKEGAIEEIRSILSEGIQGLVDVNPDDFLASTDQIMGNIQSAFKDHKENLKGLRNKKWKFAGCDVGSWLVIGTMEVAGVFTGNPLLCLTPVIVDQLVDIPKLKDLPQKYRDIVEEDTKVNRSPVGMLFNCSQ